MSNTVVIKVGGSLFDHPALGPGMRAYIAEQQAFRCFLVPGGGPAADVVRSYHHIHRLPEEFSHWLAIRMMDANGELLRHFANDKVEIVETHRFCQRDEGQALALPHDWRVTSDSIAARIAESTQASELVLLKSTDVPAESDWRQAYRQGLVDAHFADVVERSGLVVRWLNFRRRLDGLQVGRTIK